MRALIQRVSEASVTVDGEIIGRIGRGMLIFLGVTDTDTEAEVKAVADKCLNLRIFEDDAGKFNHSALEMEAELLIVSQFTLYGDTRKGRRPSFNKAAPPQHSEPLYDRFVEELRQSGLRTEAGSFGAQMNVQLVNDGPVTIMVEK
ncbi:MAG: D-aminoacyl-tRNA deacylase [Lentisphaeria bacterium]